jgi:hypothetical protein
MTLKNDIREIVNYSKHLKERKFEQSITLNVYSSERSSLELGNHTQYLFYVNFKTKEDVCWNRWGVLDTRVIIAQNSIGYGISANIHEKQQYRSTGWALTKKGAEKKAQAKAERICGMISRITGAEYSSKY